jgi:hypothetical protein
MHNCRPETFLVERDFPDYERRLIILAAGIIKGAPKLSENLQG